MSGQVVAHFSVCGHDLMHSGIRDPVFLVDRGGGDDAFDVPTVDVGEESDKRFCVIGLVFDVAEDDHPEFCGGNILSRQRWDED